MVMYLDELPTEILFRVCSFLSFANLARLADCGPVLKTIILNDFRLTYLPERVIFEGFNRGGEDMTYCHGRLIITDIRTMLRYLRLFGDSIKSLVFKNANVFEQDALLVFKYIRQYAIYVENLRLDRVIYDLGRVCTPDFSSVESITLLNCVVSKSFCNLRVFFPNLQRINICGDNKFEDMSKFIEEYPRVGFMCLNNISIKSEYVRILRDLNPQMEISFNTPFYKYHNHN